MKKKTVSPNQPGKANKRALLKHAIAPVISFLCAGSAFAASQTWSNAPANNLWNNIDNWVARAVPGALNQTGNSVNNDVATFNTAIPLSGYGGAAFPVVPDDATAVNTRSRTAGRIVFSGADCGAYVFDSPSAEVPPDATNPEAGRLHLSHGGGVTLNPEVASKQAFLLPIGVRLPSSTTGMFYITNNASSPSATLFFERLFLDGATTRGVTFVLAGSNTGTNTIASLAQSPTFTTGVSGMQKLGAGTWILPGANDFRATAPMTIAEGTLIVRNDNAFGLASTATVTNTGVLQVETDALSQMNLTVNNGGTIRANRSTTLNGLVVGAHVGTLAKIDTANASDVLTVGTGIAVGANVTGGGANSTLMTAGPGTFVFGVENDYAGSWLFAGATNRLEGVGSLGTGPNATVTAGAILDLRPMGATYWIPGTVSFGGSGMGTAVGSSAATIMADPAATIDFGTKPVSLTLTPGAADGDLTRPALYLASGTLSLGGNSFAINNASATPLGAGTYRLIQQASGNITSVGSHSVIVNGTGLAAGATAEIVVSGGNVNLVVDLYTAKNLAWKGGNPDFTWDLKTTPNFDNGGAWSVFNNTDIVIFGALGAANPNVNLVGSLAPASVTIDTAAGDYTFSGVGQIAGAAKLAKINSGVLTLGTVNTYVGGTVVSNGTLRLGISEAIPSSGSGDLAIYGSGLLDMNALNNTINGLTGNGTVDNLAPAPSVLTIGNHDRSGDFTGVMRNGQFGSLSITKIGTGVQTLSSSNAYTGTTTVSGGTLAAMHPYALGPVGDLTVNGGDVDLKTSELWVNSLNGDAGGIINNTAGTTNTLIIRGTNNVTISGSIRDGAGSSSLKLFAGTLRLNAGNPFTGGAYLASGTTLNLGNSPAGLGGFVIASNNATLGLVGGSAVPGTPAAITTVEGATVFFNSGAEGNTWSGQFFGSPTSTNRFNGPVSSSAAMSFANFPGVVQFAMTSGNFRFNNGTAGGGDTTFEFISGLVHTRDSQTVRLGSVVGGSPNAGIGGTGSAGATGTWIIGTKNVDNTFHGYISGTNNLVKSGSGRLTLDGVLITTNTDSATYTNLVYGPAISYFGNTTISNGVLAFEVPNTLSNTYAITLSSAAAMLDVSKMGYLVDQLDGLGNVTNQLWITNGLLNLYAPQTLAGLGTINGSLLADTGSIINVGQQVGTLNITGSAALNGVVNMDLNRTNAQTSDRLAAASFSGSGATLNITNLGPTLVTGDKFQLFSGPVGAFTTVNLPAASADATTPYQWQNNIASDGSITLLSGANPEPPRVGYVVAGNSITFTWASSYIGWRLIMQTNNLSQGISTNSVDWDTVPGSSTTNQVTVTIDIAKPSSFYRMVNP